MVVVFATHIIRVDLDLDWTDKILLNYVNGSITTDLEAAHMDSLATLRSVTRYANLHEQIPILEITKPSCKSMREVIQILRRHGEGDKFLLASGSKTWIYISTKHGGLEI